MLIGRGRGWESAYRDRRRHDKIVRSSQLHRLVLVERVRQGRADRPDHEPRGCPRGASFSWYTYSPARLKHPYIRGSLLERWRAARAGGAEPVAAFAQVAADGGYRGERGRGGFVRATWEEATMTSSASASAAASGIAASISGNTSRSSRRT
jgi:nitrate reductase / nitrite oxidoreductase, alpha subunit